ncbi:MAG: hypothetical protein PF549_01605 [Patescibacteria group bacterium]|jgi:hypothetical protein|nr:hypothetical protein [Patescibacteria group bacterium]
MEKQTLEKIYKLRKINADLDWKEKTKNNILQKDASLDYSFNNFLLNRSLSLVAVFAVFVLFTIPVIGSQQKDYQQTTLFSYQVEQQEDEKMLTNEEEQLVVKADEPETIKQEFATMKEDFRKYQFKILSSKTGKSDREEIAKELIMEVGREGAEEMISIFGMEEENNSEALEDMKEAFQEGDYNKVFDIYLEEL